MTARKPVQDPPFFYSLAQATEEIDALVDEVDAALGCSVGDLADRGSYEAHLTEFVDVVTVLDSYGHESAPLGARQLRRAIARAVVERIVGAGDVVMYVDRTSEDEGVPIRLGGEIIGHVEKVSTNPDGVTFTGRLLEGAFRDNVTDYVLRPLIGREPDSGGDVVPQVLYEKPDPKIAAANLRYIRDSAGSTPQVFGENISDADGLPHFTGLRGPDKPKDGKP